MTEKITQFALKIPSGLFDPEKDRPKAGVPIFILLNGDTSKMLQATYLGGTFYSSQTSGDGLFMEERRNYEASEILGWFYRAEILGTFEEGQIEIEKEKP